jgi:poly-beta-1,6-N-acetyl-D-glucosamine synthase
VSPFAHVPHWTEVIHWTLFDFTFLYPLFMAWFWMIAGLFFWFKHEWRVDVRVPKPLKIYPPISIIIPMYNEGDTARETIAQVMRTRYPHYEVIAVNDGSKDETGAILDELMGQYPRLRVIHQAENQGKAIGLDTAAVFARYEYFVCIDGDALIDEDACTWIMWHFENGPRVAAVTGNPRVRNRSTILGRLQVGEFSSIIGLIKRAQRVYGRVFTVSGVIVGFRRAAMHDIGYWSPEMLTEDIDVSWKLQLRSWDIRFEPRAVVWILMPETLTGLWKQRLRWAMGGVQTLGKYFPLFFVWRCRRMWPIYIEFAVSVFWAYCMAIAVLLWLGGELGIRWPRWLWVDSMVPGWNGLLIGLTCMAQIGVSLLFDSRYDHKLSRVYPWMVWYPVAYWVLNTATTIWAVPKTLMRKRGSRGRWTSPDRGAHMPQPGSGVSAVEADAPAPANPGS